MGIIMDALKALTCLKTVSLHFLLPFRLSDSIRKANFGQLQGVRHEKEIKRIGKGIEETRVMLEPMLGPAEGGYALDGAITNPYGSLEFRPQEHLARRAKF